MRTKLCLLVCSLVLFAAKCQPSPRPPEPDAGAGSGGSPVVDVGGTGGSVAAGSGGAPAADDCERAERLAESFGCPLKKPKRASWAEVCRNGRANGVDMQDDCVLKAHDCAGVHKCTSESAP